MAKTFLKLLQGGKQDRVRPEVRASFPDRAAVAHRITLARELAGLTVRQAARVTCLSVDWLSSLEAGLAEPTWSDLHILGDAYEASSDWFLGRVPEQADTSELAGMKMAEEQSFRLLTILAMGREAGCA